MSERNLPNPEKLKGREQEPRKTPDPKVVKGIGGIALGGSGKK